MRSKIRKENKNFEYFSLIKLFDKHEAINFLNKLLESNLNLSSTSFVDYEYLISIKEYFKDDSDIISKCNEIEHLIYENYIYKVKLEHLYYYKEY